MFKSLAKQIVDRVFKSYRSTLVGLLCGVGVIAIDALVVQLDGQPSPVAKILASVAVLAGAALRKKALAPQPLEVVPPPPPAA